MPHTTNAIVATSKLIALGDAIREKAGLSGDMTLDEMATAVSNIETGGGTSMVNVRINDNMGLFVDSRVPKNSTVETYIDEELAVVYQIYTVPSGSMILLICGTPGNPSITASNITYDVVTITSRPLSYIYVFYPEDQDAVVTVNA